MLDRLRPTLAAALLLAASPGWAQEPGSGTGAREEPRAPGPVMRIDGEAIPAEAFGRWLIEAQAGSAARSFAEAWAVEREARRRRIEVSPQELAAELEAEIDERVEGAFLGIRDDWRGELQRLGRSEGGHRAQRTVELRPRLAAKGMAALGRVVPEDKIVRDWELAYGPRGRHMELLMLKFQVEVPTATEGDRRVEQAANRERAMAEGLERARRARERALAGEDFGALARELSDDAATRHQGGWLLGGFRQAGWPHAFIDALLALQPDEISGPLYARGGWWVVKLLSERRTPLDEVRDELEARLIAKGPEQDEVGRAWDAAVKDLEVEILPGMYAAAPQAEEAHADPAALRIDGVEVTRSAFALWLLHLRGEPLATRFAEAWLVEREARARGIAVSDAEVLERTEQYLGWLIDEAHHGSREAWLAYVALSGREEPAVVREIAARMRTHLLAERLMQAEREITPEAVRRRFEELYGSSGRAVRARLILLRVPPPPLGAGLTREELDARFAEARRAVGERAEHLARRLEDGEDFAALARKHSEDPATAAAGGLLPDLFRPGAWPAEVAEAVLALRPGQVSAPLFAGRDWVIFEALSSEPVRLEEVEGDLRAGLAAARPAEVEIAAYRNVLLKRAEVEVLPSMYE
ncbi:MAG TPA: peptidylprolyl isomerase [Planctomycetota bacterium]|nr:peptidylprolyl isomerase [Planctomycetota bacterium]